MRKAALLYPLVLACGLGACSLTEPKNGAEEAAERRERALAQRLKQACSSPATYERLKQVAFDEAIRIRNADPVNLDLLSTHASVRVENPVVKSRDETLDVTVCSGRFVLHVPPGAERAFDGKRYLAADIEYAAQAAADGSGLVYQIKGAEPIIYRLAAFDLRTQGRRPLPSPKPTAVAVVTASPSPRPQPSETRPPAATRAPSSPNPKATRQAATASPSFNCRAARSRSERMVCGSERLASLDRAMSSQFYSALSRGDEHVRAELRRSRDRFLAYRERCGDAGCVEQAYRDRMDEIRDIASGR